jgi:hypothetical protein
MTTEAVGECQVTYANYMKLHPGIRYSAAVRMLGCPGREMSRVDIPGTSTTILYGWDGNEGWGSNMNAMFQGGFLVTKAQLGLK